MNRRVWGILTVAALLVGLGLFVAGDRGGPPGEPGTPSAEGDPAQEAGETRDAAEDEAADLEEDGDTVRVTVLSRTDRSPIAGATISQRRAYRRHEPIGVTGADGTVRVSRPKLVSSRVIVHREGFVRARDWIEQEDREKTFLLEPGVPLTGRVVDAGDGRAITGASVVVRDEETLDEIAGPTESDAEGRFAIDGVRTGFPFSLEVTKPGFGPAWIRDRREVGGGEIVVRLGGGAVIRGRVDGDDGTPAAGANVHFVLEGHDFRQVFLSSMSCEIPGLEQLDRAVAGPDGRYEIRGLPVPSTWLLVATAGRDRSAAIRVFVTEEGAAVRRDFALQRGTAVRVRLTGPGGGPVPEAHVTCRGEGGRSGLPMELGKEEASKPEADGTWLLFPEGVGPYTVRATAPGHPPVERVVEAEAGEDPVVELAFGTGAALVGRVLGPEDEPVSEARVSFSVRGGNGFLRQHAKAETGPDGRFRIEGLQAAAGTVSVTCRARRQERLKDIRPGGDPVTIRLSGTTTIRGRFAPPPGTDRMRTSYRNPGGGGSSGGDRIAPDGSFVLVPSFYTVSRGDGGFHLTLTPKGRPPVEFPDLRIAPGETLDLGEITLDEGVAVAGTVRDHRGSPVRGARVCLWMKMLFDAEVVYTDAEGRFRFAGLARAPASLHVESERLLVPTGRKIADTATAGHLTIDLEPAGAAAITAVGSEGMPVSGLTIVLGPVEGEGPTHISTWGTDSGGRARIVAPPGRYRIRHHGGPDSGEGPVMELAAGRETNVRLKVPFRGPVGEVWSNIPR